MGKTTHREENASKSRLISDFFPGLGERPAKTRKLSEADDKEPTRLDNKTAVPPTKAMITDEWAFNRNILKRRYGKIPKVDDKSTGCAVIGLDLDSTLVNTKTRIPHPRNKDDWKWFNDYTKDILMSLCNKPDSMVVIFSNQGGVVPNGKRYETFTGRIENIINDLGQPVEIWVYAATKAKKDDKVEESNRKPGSGMWTEFEADFKSLTGSSINYNESIFVGDAAGGPKDFSDSDLKFAKNIGVEFKTPGEFWVKGAAVDSTETASDSHFEGSTEASINSSEKEETAE